MTTRIAPDWLQETSIQAIFGALHAAGGQTRVVGGAVRDALIGRDAGDVDLATTLTPDVVKAACTAAGLKTVDTGLVHGTVSVISGWQAFEVTTLRRDLATDGRHATVAFTDDWAADASRRDFTINALYCDADGTVFDPLGGVDDLHAGRVRFIGDATARIREDYLRILRFFRFSARFASGALDQDGLLACSRERAGLQRLAAERVRVEISKTLVAPKAVEIAQVLHEHGFWPALLGCAVAPEHLARIVPLTEDWVARLAALAVSIPEHAEMLAARLKLSGHDRHRLRSIVTEWSRPWTTLSDHELRFVMYEVGSYDARPAAAVAAARDGGGAVWEALFDRLEATPAPRFPLAGKDLLAAGIAPGPEIGRRLARAEAAWIASDFSLDREALVAIALDRRAGVEQPRR